MAGMATHAVMGIIPPETAEARIVMRWPSVAAHLGGGPARLGSAIQQTATKLVRSTIQLPAVVAWIPMIVVVPLATLMAFGAWAMLAPFYFIKVLPLLGTRYLLTNRRLMISRGIQGKPSQEVKLEEIDEVRVVPGTEQPFYLSADLEIISGGRPVMVLRGVQEYQGFIVNIQNTYLAWGRKSPPKEQIQPASAMK